MPNRRASGTFIRARNAALSLEEFGRMLMTHAGWGMRIEFGPDDELHRRPTLEVRKPDPEGTLAES
jgi:hypothetical protein